jgi:hypothetical protein
VRARSIGARLVLTAGMLPGPAGVLLRRCSVLLDTLRLENF